MISLDEMDADITRETERLDALETTGQDVSEDRQQLAAMGTTRDWMSETFAVVACRDNLARRYGAGRGLGIVFGNRLSPPRLRRYKGMTDKNSRPMSPNGALRSVGLTVAALRKAQGKSNPNDFPIGSPEFEAAELDFLDDVLRFREGDMSGPLKL